MYKDNKRVRDDWIGKNMQYLIGRVGLFKHFQGKTCTHFVDRLFNTKIF